MKNIILLTSLCFFSILNAQDLITKTNGESIKGLVSEITPSEIVFSYPNEKLINRISIDQVQEIVFKSGRTQKFIIRTGNQNINPNDYFNIFCLESTKKKRIIEVAQTNSLGTSKAMDFQFKKFNAIPYGKNSFLIEVESLEKNEYAITLKDNRLIFNMFGVD